MRVGRVMVCEDGVMVCEGRKSDGGEGGESDGV